MTFLEPLRLVLVVGPIAIAIAYVVMQFQRSKYAVRFSNVNLLASVAPKRPGWPRHIAAVLVIAAMVAMVAAFAVPARDVQVPKERATIILALDVSLSMEATDVEPDRITVAKEAASAFVDQVPERFQLGCVVFSGNARVVVAPTDQHEKVLKAIERVDLDEGTGIGEAIYASLDAIADVNAENPDPAPARIVLLSDGKTTVGRPNEQATDAAVDARVPIDTIAFGTDDGVVTLRGDAVPVPVDRESLRQIAETTGGTSFDAFTGDELNDVFDTIGSSIGYDTEQREITPWFAGLGFLLLLAGSSAALVWTQRLP